MNATAVRPIVAEGAVVRPDTFLGPAIHDNRRAGQRRRHRRQVHDATPSSGVDIASPPVMMDRPSGETLVDQMKAAIPPIATPLPAVGDNLLSQELRQLRAKPLGIEP